MPSLAKFRFDTAEMTCLKLHMALYHSAMVRSHYSCPQIHMERPLRSEVIQTRFSRRRDGVFALRKEEDYA